jgi:folate-binding protein YgfZ
VVATDRLRCTGYARRPARIKRESCLPRQELDAYALLTSNVHSFTNPYRKTSKKLDKCWGIDGNGAMVRTASMLGPMAPRLTFCREFWQESRMHAALLPDRGVIKVIGDDARRFLNGLLTADIGKVGPGRPAFAALLTPQGKIIADFIVAEAEAEDGGGFFVDCPRALAQSLAERLNFYRLRAKIAIEDLSQTLGVLAAWDGTGATDCGLVYPDPRLPALGLRCILPPDAVAEAAAGLGAALTDAAAYDAHRIAQGIPRGGLDFSYGDAFPHETDMDQLGGVDFAKGCYIGQEVVSRVEHRGTARTRIVPIAYDGFAPEPGMAIMAGEKEVGRLGSTAAGHGLAMLRLDRVEDALAAGLPLTAGGVPVRASKPAWARFTFSGKAGAAG